MHATRRRFALAFLAAAAVTMLGGLSAFGQGPEKLFFIQRSKNANEVHYDARIGADGAIDPKNPIDAYWIMKAKGGERESIGLLEKIAYGYDMDPAADGKYTLKLKAFKDRPLTVEKAANGHFRARVTIGGKQAYLKRIYVASDESGMTPKVLYVDLFGEDVNGGAVQEHVVKN